MADTAERERGPVEILCKEIGFRFDRRMEMRPLFVSFVSVLIDEVADRFEVEQRILGYCKDHSGTQMVVPDDKAPRVITAARAMLVEADLDAMIVSAARVHDLCGELNPEGVYPTNHTIDMLSSCASAIRFGLEKPCHSRHAAEAASHIWSKKYNVGLFDSLTPDWCKDWSRTQMQEAILRLALSTTGGSRG